MIGEKIFDIHTTSKDYDDENVKKCFENHLFKFLLSSMNSLLVHFQYEQSYDGFQICKDIQIFAVTGDPERIQMMEVLKENKVKSIIGKNKSMNIYVNSSNIQAKNAVHFQICEKMDKQEESVMEMMVESIANRLFFSTIKIDYLKEKMENMEKRMGSIEERMESMEERMGNLEEKIDTLINLVGHNLVENNKKLG